jgi:hypothetical protein
MLNSFKTRTPILALFLFVFSVGYTFAANKVVVIPMGADAALDIVSSYNQITSDVAISGITPTPVNFVHIGVPSSGMLFASGTVSLVHSAGKAIRCALSMTGVIESKFESVWKPPVGTDLTNTLTSLHQFKIDAGLHTVNHLCKADDRGTATAIRGNVTLLFIPD